MVASRVGLLICALALGGVSPGGAQTTPVNYVVLGQQGSIARSVVPVAPAGPALACPTIVLDGSEKKMSLRAAPDADFPILVCEFVIPAATKTAVIAGNALPLPPAAINSIAAFGDTGCRIKVEKSKQGVHDTDEEDEDEGNGNASASAKPKVQDCKDPKDWPFAEMSKTIANARPDVVIHVGDYYYRESACPPGFQEQCGNSPHGDNWDTWFADFFGPAKPLLDVSPWIATRGNHEICERGGIGYARLLDPSPATGPQPACVEMMDQYTITVGGHAFVVLDSSNAADECPKEGCNIAPYLAQFAAMNPAPGTWLVTHRPIWGFTNSKNDSGDRKLGIRNMTLQAALAKWNGRPPKGIDLVLSGHIHLWEALSFADGRSPQFVLGAGSTKLAHKITEDLPGQTIGGTTVAAAATEHHFGYTIFKPAAGGATFYDTGGNALVACDVGPTATTCKEVKPK
jgi:Calcineurin-like phosphoesterase